MKYISLFILFLLIASSAEAQVTRYVSTSGDDQDGANTCFDSEAPCRTIGQAINVASSADSIIVAGGAYTESLNIDKSLIIEGAGEGITIIQAHADPFTADERVITIEGDDGSPKVEISGLTIRHGNPKDELDALDDGGGIYNDQAGLTLESVTFSANSGDLGGGLYSVDSSPTLTYVTFTGNEAEFGGGMHNRRGDPILTDITFINNTATEQGGGFYNVDNSDPRLTDVVFEDNHSENRGGAITSTLQSHPVFTNVTFDNNSADSDGGAFRNSGSSHPEFYNVTFTGNTAVQFGGAISNSSSSSPVFTGVTFSNNSAGMDGVAWTITDPLILCSPM